MNVFASDFGIDHAHGLGDMSGAEGLLDSLSAAVDRNPLILRMLG